MTAGPDYGGRPATHGPATDEGVGAVFPAPRREGDLRISRVVCGGQTGVDRAAVRAALSCGIPYGGWVPRGGWAEDHPDAPGVLARYPAFRATPSPDPAERTAWNVRDSDLTLLLVPPGVASPGCDTTRAAAARLGRPLVDVTAAGDQAAQVAHLRQRLSRSAGGGVARRGAVVNVAGPRESESPGIEEWSLLLLRALLAGADGT